MATKFVGFQVDEALWFEVKKKALERGKKLKEHVRDVLVSDLEDEKPSESRSKRGNVVSGAQPRARTFMGFYGLSRPLYGGVVEGRPAKT